MKKLIDYLPRVFKQNYQEKPHDYVKEDYVGNNEVICQLDDGTILNDFNEFIKENHILTIDENTYYFFLDSIYGNHLYKYIDNPYTYLDYQKSVYIFENILHSYSSRNLYNKLQDIFGKDIIKVDFVNPKKEITQFKIFIKDSLTLYNILNDDKFWSTLRLYNYYDKIINDTENEVSIILEPYKPQDITNKIYDEFNGIIYHVTSKEIYLDHIKNKAIIPKWKMPNNHSKIFRDGRIFFIANNDDKKAQKQLQSLANLKNIQDPIVLKINLKEYRNKLRFRIDSSAFGYDAYFTEEPIPDFCITCLDLNTWKEILK